jgi:ApbE superfamily uncharacterized protein (UPF0280 family)
VGHSLSFGRADAVVVLAPSVTLADAAATAIGNRVSQPADIPKDDQLGVSGKVKIVSIGGEGSNVFC